MNLETYPQRIVKPLIELEKTNDLAAEHKLLLDLGETLLTHITGIIFGEYKSNWNISDRLEAEFYRNAKRKPSFGVFLGLLRLLMKVEGKSVFDEYFEKGCSYPAVSEFVFNYNLLKSEVVNKGKDNGFKDELESLKKGRTIAAKSGLEFFESFVTIRNAYAHPEEKAKNPLRNWPLGDEYYELINPLMKSALMELISSLTVLNTHRPVLAEKIDDKNQKVSFLEEVGKKEKQLVLDLTEEDLKFITSDFRYLLDEDNKLLSKFYQAEVPQVNPSVAEKIIEKEKAKMMEPILVEMIREKLDDGVIDELEYMVLKDTASTSYINEEKLKQLIDKTCQELGITGENVIVATKPPPAEMIFNPYWVTHFGALTENSVEQSEDPYNNTNVHKNLWKEVNNYLDRIIKKHLDNNMTLWSVKANQYQIGNLSYTYWGQIYPKDSPFENAFNVGLAITKKFKWIKKAPRGTDLWKKLRNPALIIWATQFDTLVERIDQDNVLMQKYRELQYDLLMNNKEKFSELNSICIGADDIPMPAGEYFESIGNEVKNVRLYSPIWNIEDFTSEGMIDFDKLSQIDKEIVAYINIFANVVERITDYALEIGVNKETFIERLDKSKRNEKMLEDKIKEYRQLNKNDEDSTKELKQFAKELGLQENQIKLVFSRARWVVE